jgi:hypothetical protein
VKASSFGTLNLAAFLLIASPAAIARAFEGGDEEPVRVQLEEAAPEDEGKDPGPFSATRELRVPLDLGREALLLEAESDTDVTNYFLELEVIPEYTEATVTAVRVEGLSTIDLEPTTDGLTSFTVDLHSSLSVNSVAGDVASWSRVGHTVEIQLDRAYDAGESVQVAVAYEGYPQTAGYGAFRWWVRDGNLVIATLSEPFYARYWWPCKDALDDKATMQMHVTVPSSFVALSNGLELGSEALAEDRTKYLWSETHPMAAYLASLAIASYQRYELQYDYDLGGSPAAMSVPCYVYPDHWDFGEGEPLALQKAGCDELPGRSVGQHGASDPQQHVEGPQLQRHHGARARAPVVGRRSHLRNVVRHLAERGVRNLLRGALSRASARGLNGPVLEPDEHAAALRSRRPGVPHQHRHHRRHLQYERRLPEGRVGGAHAAPCAGGRCLLRGARGLSRRVSRRFSHDRGVRRSDHVELR